MKIWRALCEYFFARHRPVPSMYLEAPIKRAEPRLEGDRRRSRRQCVPAAAWYRTDTMPFNRSQVVECSATGARMLVHRDVKVGDRLEVTLKTAAGRYVTATSRVVWIQGLPGGVRQMAGMALDVCPADRRALEA